MPFPFYCDPCAPCSKATLRIAAEIDTALPVRPLGFDLADPNGGCTNCDPSDVLPAFWGFTMSGVTQGLNCADSGCVDQVNGTFSLSYNGGCAWSVNSIAGPGCQTNSGYVVAIDSTGMILTFGEVGVDSLLKQWKLAPLSAVDCLGTNILTRIGGPNTSQCNDYPATVTVDPV